MSNDRTGLAVVGVGVLGLLFHFAFWGGICYVAWHFVSKLW